jgi:hypothetical protein
MGATWTTLENTGLKSRHLETTMSRALSQPNTQQRPNNPSSLSGFGDPGRPSGEARTVLFVFEAHTEPSSLSDLEVVGYKSTAAAHFSPYFCLIAGLLGCKSGKNCARWGRFSLSTIQRQAGPWSFFNENQMGSSHY